MIPEAGYKGMPKLFSDGVLVVGDSAMLANPVTGEGADLAILSGRMAGEVATKAHAMADYSSGALASYQDNLLRSFAVRDMRKQSGLLQYIENDPDIMNAYPAALNDALAEWFRVDGATRSDKVKRIRTLIMSKRKLAKMMKDAYVIGRKLM